MQVVTESYDVHPMSKRVLPNATVLLTTTACGVDLVYWLDIMAITR